MIAAWLVGNDVVDLRAAAAAPRSGRPRFLARVCDEAEQARVGAAAEPATALWTLFAAKEAAYKVVAKLRPQPIFAHRRYRVAADHATIDADGVPLALWVDVDLAAGWVHVVASTRDDRPLAAVEALADHDAQVAAGAPGRGARRLVTALVAARLGLAAGDLAIERPPRPGAWDGAGPPVIVRGGRPLGVDVSLSHDGRLIAGAAALVAASRPDGAGFAPDPG